MSAGVLGATAVVAQRVRAASTVGRASAWAVVRAVAHNRTYGYETTPGGNDGSRPPGVAPGRGRRRRGRSGPHPAQRPDHDRLGLVHRPRPEGARGPVRVPDRP